MTSLAEKNGWFAPASEILDFLLKQHEKDQITRIGRAYLCFRWLWEKARDRH